MGLAPENSREDMWYCVLELDDFVLKHGARTQQCKQMYAVDFPDEEQPAAPALLLATFEPLVQQFAAPTLLVVPLHPVQHSNERPSDPRHFAASFGIHVATAGAETLSLQVFSHRA